MSEDPMTNSISEALKPCPFCGSPGELFQRWKPSAGMRSDAYTMARCTNREGYCGVLIDVAERTPAAATEAWNTRASQPVDTGVGECPRPVRRVVHELRVSMGVFRDYGYQHQVKADALAGSSEKAARIRKAKRNHERADACREALAAFDALPKPITPPLDSEAVERLRRFAVDDEHWQLVWSNSAEMKDDLRALLSIRTGRFPTSADVGVVKPVGGGEGRTLESLLRMTVPVPEGCVAPAGTPMTPEFRLSVQRVRDDGVHFIVHAHGHNSATLDLVARGNTLAALTAMKEDDRG